MLIPFCILENFSKSRKFLLARIFFVLLLFLIAAFRHGVDRDYSTYMVAFEMFKEPLDYFIDFDSWVFFEPMYYLIPSFSKTYLSQEFFSLITFIFYAFLGVGIKLFAISRLTEKFFLSVLVYLCFFFLLHEMTQIRAGVATGIMLVCIYLIEKKKFGIALILTSIACIFHYSSFFILPIFLLKNKSLNKKLYLGLMMVTLILAFVDTSFILSFLNLDLGAVTLKAANYVTMHEAGEMTDINKLNLHFLITFGSTLVFVFFAEKVSQENKYANILLKVQVLGLLLFQLLSSVPALSFRISDFYYTTQIITFTFFMYLFRNRMLGLLITIGISLGLLLINLYYIKLIKPYF